MKTANLPVGRGRGSGGETDLGNEREVRAEARGAFKEARDAARKKYKDARDEARKAFKAEMAAARKARAEARA